MNDLNILLSCSGTTMSGRQARTGSRETRDRSIPGSGGAGRPGRGKEGRKEGGREGRREMRISDLESTD